MNIYLIIATIVHLLFGFFFAGMFMEIADQKKSFGMGMIIALACILIPFGWLVILLIGSGAKYAEK